VKKKIKQQPRAKTKHHQSPQEDLYRLGSTLYKNKHYLEALLTWWPILKKRSDELYSDCLEIALFIESNIASVLQSNQLHASKPLHKLLMACKHLIPSSPACDHIERKLLDTLWQEKKFDVLEHHLKTNFKNKHATNLHALSENLGKLAFLQANKKYNSNIPAFIGFVLTGGASLILNTPAYQPELETTLLALGQELNHIMLHDQHRLKQKYVWDATMLSQWIDYEICILTQVLKQALAHPSHAPDIIPTPSYYLHSASAHVPLDKNFLAWLTSQNKSLAALYDTHVQHAVLWVLGGEKRSEITDCLESTAYPSWDPYLQLAIALRAEAIKPVSIDNLFIRRELFSQTETILPLKKIASHTAHAMLNANVSTHDKRQQTILAKLIELLPNVQDLGLQHMHHCIQRQQACIVFLNLLADNKSQKTISAIKTYDNLREHLTLIADTALLVPDDDGIDLYWHMSKLIKNKRLQSFMPVHDHFTEHGECCCECCIERMIKQTIPCMAKAFDLPVVSFKPHLASPPSSKPTRLFQSILSQADPFQTLGASVHDSKQAMMKKVMTCIQQSPENMATFRQAQHALFDLPQRFLYHYLCYLNLPNAPAQVVYEHVEVA